MLYLFVISIVLIFSCTTVNKSGIIDNKNIKLKCKYFHLLHNIIYNTVFLILFALTAFRGPTIGNDTLSYIQIFNNITTNTNSYLFSHFEIGFRYFCLFVAKISTNPQTIIIASSIFTYGLLWLYFKQYCYMPLLALTLFWGLFFSQFTNVIRHTMAAVCLLYAFNKINDKKLIPAVIITIVAISFHKTATIFFIYIFISFFNIKFRKVYLLVPLILAVSLLFFERQFLTLVTYVVKNVDEYYLRYFMGCRVGSGRLGICLSILILSLIFFTYIHFLSPNSNSNNDKWIFYFAFLFFNMALFMNLFDRIANYFVLISIVPTVNKIVMSNNHRYSRLYINCLVDGVVISFLIKIIMRPEWNNLYPYSFFW